MVRLVSKLARGHLVTVAKNLCKGEREIISCVELLTCELI